MVKCSRLWNPPFVNDTHPITLHARTTSAGVTILKRICRRFGLPRWPYRRSSEVRKLCLAWLCRSIRSQNLSLAIISTSPIVQPSHQDPIAQNSRRTYATEFTEETCATVTATEDTTSGNTARHPFPVQPSPFESPNISAEQKNHVSFPDFAKFSNPPNGPPCSNVQDTVTTTQTTASEQHRLDILISAINYSRSAGQDRNESLPTSSTCLTQKTAAAVAPPPSLLSLPSPPSLPPPTPPAPAPQESTLLGSSNMSGAPKANATPMKNKHEAEEVAAAEHGEDGGVLMDDIKVQLYNALEVNPALSRVLADVLAACSSASASAPNNLINAIHASVPGSAFSTLPPAQPKTPQAMLAPPPNLHQWLNEQLQMTPAQQPLPSLMSAGSAFSSQQEHLPLCYMMAQQQQDQWKLDIAQKFAHLENEIATREADLQRLKAYMLQRLETLLQQRQQVVATTALTAHAHAQTQATL